MDPNDRHYAVAVPAEACSLRLVRAFFEPLLCELCGEEEGARAVLALGEACANVVEHRCVTIDDGRLCVRLDLAGDRVQLRIGRFCKTEDVPDIKPRALDDVKPGGLGTHFIREIMDRIEFQPDPDRPDCMMLLLEKRCANQAPEGGDG